MKSVALLSILVGVCYGAALPRTPPRNCPTFCPRIWSPICAADGKEFRTFPNDCELEAINCWQSTDFELLKAGECEVTGKFGFVLFEKTVKNLEPIQKVKEDSVPVAKNCKPCTREYRPVCGSDSQEKRVFGNECELNFTNCIESRDFTLLRDGEC